jgi:hypothetical protein
VGLWAVAVLGFITSIQRMVWAMRALDKFDATERVRERLRERPDVGEDLEP